ncbi:hypothetical protein CDAR_292341 [Caerostris darwini]|uniref:Transposase n=1 Tax=Caerostris darwini TaxID=1538125 RepID=A0AAV4UD36_9ARAC|nr:hypothetical protein CDAR_292341 [Caerostris darwini]
MTVAASSGTGARFIFDTKHDIVLFLIPCLLGQQSKKGRRILSDALIGCQGLVKGGGIGWAQIADSFDFIHNESKRRATESSSSEALPSA